MRPDFSVWLVWLQILIGSCDKCLVHADLVPCTENIRHRPQPILLCWSCSNTHRQPRIFMILLSLNLKPNNDISSAFCQEIKQKSPGSVSWNYLYIIYFSLNVCNLKKILNKDKVLYFDAPKSSPSLQVFQYVIPSNNCEELFQISSLYNYKVPVLAPDERRQLKVLTSLWFG